MFLLDRKRVTGHTGAELGRVGEVSMDRTVTFVCGKLVPVCKSFLECPASRYEFPGPFLLQIAEFSICFNLHDKGHWFPSGEPKPHSQESSS